MGVEEGGTSQLPGVRHVNVSVEVQEEEESEEKIEAVEEGQEEMEEDVEEMKEGDVEEEGVVEDETGKEEEEGQEAQEGEADEQKRRKQQQHPSTRSLTLPSKPKPPRPLQNRQPNRATNLRWHPLRNQHPTPARKQQTPRRTHRETPKKLLTAWHPPLRTCAIKSQKRPNNSLSSRQNN